MTTPVTIEDGKMYGHRARLVYTSPPLTTEVFPYEFYKIVPDGVSLVVTSLAIVAYCSTRKLETGCWSASLPKPLPKSSAGSEFAGELVSPKRLATVLLYSKRVRRRIDARLGCGVEQSTTGSLVVPPAPLAMPLVPSVVLTVLV